MSTLNPTSQQTEQTQFKQAGDVRKPQQNLNSPGQQTEQTQFKKVKDFKKPLQKRVIYNNFKYSTLKTVCTHPGQFQADEVLGCAMLFYFTEQYKNCRIIRSVDPVQMKNSDLCLDIGRRYSESENIFDHTQHSFQEKFSENSRTKMSSAGIIYKLFGMEVLENLIKEVLQRNPKCKFDALMTQTELERAYNRFYFQFVHAFDCIDNGIDFGRTPFLITTTIIQRIERLNPNQLFQLDETVQFYKAMNLSKEELLQQTQTIITWLEQNRSIELGFKKRFNIDPSGRILEVEHYGNWSLVHLFYLENTQKVPDTDDYSTT